MGDYVIKKILNNNVVIAERDKEEFVLVGKAIGHDSIKGSHLSENKVESVFVKKSNYATENFNRVLENINGEVIGISEEIIAMGEKKLGERFNEAVHISLPDHINFAIRRIEKGVKIENPFLQELKVLYTEEYKLAEIALRMINERFSVNLPDDEIGFICMHIKAAVRDQALGNTLAYAKKIGEVMDMISKLLKKDFNKSSLEYTRTLTHLNFMIERIMDNKTVKNYLLDTIKKDLYTQYDIAIKLAMKIENLFSLKVPEDEIGYIALHLNRLSEL